MAIEVAGKVEIEAPREATFAAVSDLEGWTEWARDIERVAVLDRDGEGRPSRVRMVADLFGKEFDATADFAHDAPSAITFDLVEARKLSTLEGGFRFEAGPAGTLLAFRVLMVLVKPKAARIERMVGRKIETAFSRDLRRHVERNVARRR